MAWDGNYFGPEGALEEARKKYRDSDRTPFDAIAYASVKYSAANRIAADVRSLKWNGISRLKQCLDLASQAVLMVDAAWINRDQLTDAWNVNVNRRRDALDVSCAIWLRWGWIHFGRSSSARLELLPLSWREESDLLPHTKAFLTIHAIRAKLIVCTSGVIAELESLAAKSAAAGELGQASRICRHTAAFLPVSSRKDDLLSAAQGYAQRGQVFDQMVKLGRSTERV